MNPHHGYAANCIADGALTAGERLVVPGGVKPELVQQLLCYLY
jgi:hypothetical protein